MEIIESAAGMMLAHMAQIFESNNYEFCGAESNAMQAVRELSLKDMDRFSEDTIEAKRYRHVVENILEQDSAAQDVLDLSLAAMLYPEFDIVLKRETLFGVTVKNGWFAEGNEHPQYAQLLKTYRLCRRIFDLDDQKYPFFNSECNTDNRLLAFLSGDDETQRVAGIGKLNLYLYEQDKKGQTTYDEDAAGKLIHYMESSNLVVLKGKVGSGKKELVKYAAYKGKRNIVFCDFSCFTEDNFKRMLFHMRREAFFYDATVAVTGLTGKILKDKKLTIEEAYNGLIAPLLEDGLKVCVCCEDTLELIPTDGRVADVVKVEIGSRSVSIRLWKSLAKEYGMNMDCVSLGTRYKLSVDELNYVFLQLQERLLRGEQVDEFVITRLCREMIGTQVEKGQIINPDGKVTLDDLVVPREDKEVIKRICNHVWYAAKVYEEWNMEEKYLYGKGVPVLFSGPPGTGKTMAAHVISNILDMPLYKVDLSQIVDKYIGETEKHLSKIFDFAREHSLILFFDEADALFGKRSEVKDAKDRYANTEIAYLLQLVESYEGIVILATNLRSNIDPAFTRRLKYMIHFAMPDEKTRLAIWKKGFPKETKTGEIDYHYLARQFPLSGGNIKNIILSASFYAAGRQESVGMEHILTAVRDEYAKYDKKMEDHEFGEYGYMF